MAIHTDSAGLDAGPVSIPAGDREIPAYRALPHKGGKPPVVIVVQEIFGVTPLLGAAGDAATVDLSDLFK